MKRSEQHRWKGRPGRWACKRCGTVTADRHSVDRMCWAVLSHQFDYDAPAPPARRAVPTRLDTPERVNDEQLTLRAVPTVSGVRERIDENP